MPLGRYVVGIVLGAVALGPIVAAALRLRRAALPGWEGPPAYVAAIALALGLSVVALELAGIAGIFDRVGTVVACLAVGAAAWLAARPLARAAAWAAGPATAPAPRNPGHRDGVAKAVVLVAVALTGAAWLGWVVSAYRTGISSVDTLWYHLPFAARFAQSGSILHLHYVDRDPVTAFYPANSELFHALGLVLFRSDVLTPAINLAWAGLALLAGWAVGRPYGRGPHCLLAVVIVLATPGLLDTQPGGAYDDVVGIALLLSAAALLVNGGLSGPSSAIAAIAAGVAFGTKYQFVVPALALAAGVVALSSRRRLRQAAIWMGGLLLFGGYWYVRNLVIVGNPVPSLAHLGPLTLPSPHVSTPSFTVGQYLFNGTVWRAFYLPGLRDSLGRAWWAVLAVALAGALGALALDREPIRRMIGAVAAVGVIAFIVTPQFLGLPGLPVFFVDNVRYLAAPLALGAVLLPVNRLLRSPAFGSAWLLGASAIVVATAIDRSFWRTGFTLHPYPGPVRGSGAIAAGAVIGVLILLGVPLAAWAMGRARARARVARSVLFAGGPVALLIGGWFVADSYAHRRFSATAPAPRIYAWAQHVRETRIGVVGLDEQYPLYGPDDSNYVQYVGRPMAHSGFGPIGTCKAWRVAVNREHYRWLVLAPFGYPINASVKIAPEARWTLTSPNARLVIREQPSGDVPGETAMLVRVTGPLDPATC